MTESTMPPWAGPDLDAEDGAEGDATEHAAELTTGGEPTLEELLRVVVHNDETTPYAYVTQTLGSVFMLSDELAEHIARTAHDKGAAVVVIRPRHEAETLAKVARGRAKVNKFPLMFTLEQEA